MPTPTKRLWDLLENPPGCREHRFFIQEYWSCVSISCNPKRKGKFFLVLLHKLDAGDGSDWDRPQIHSAPGGARFQWDLYHALFDREPDAGGYNAWMSYMLEGHGRAEVIYGFTHSQEFYNLCSSYNVYP